MRDRIWEEEYMKGDGYGDGDGEEEEDGWVTEEEEERYLELDSPMKRVGVISVESDHESAKKEEH